MKRTVFFALLLLLAAAVASAGVTYEFTMNVDGAGGGMAGTASADGPRSRAELTRGDGLLFEDGSVIVSADGGRTLHVLDPGARTYYRLSSDLFAKVGTLVKNMGSMLRISVSNPKVAVRSAGAGAPIEGYPTTRYEIDASYDLAMTVLGSQMKSRVVMRSEVWTTPRLAAAGSFIQESGIRTGIEEIDALIASQAAGVKGFPLRQVTTMTTTQGKKTATQTSTFTVSKIREQALDASLFAVPAGYRETKSPIERMLGGGKP